MKLTFVIASTLGVVLAGALIAFYGLGSILERSGPSAGAPSSWR